MRPRGMFGMILDGKSREMAMPHSFQAAVIEIDMSKLNGLFIQTGKINGKAMIL